MLKRLIDITASSAALILLSPIYVAVAYKVKKNLGSPVLFKQTRPGLDAKPFEIIKFRTMKQATDAEGNLLPDSERLTQFGQILRSTSLDELPELWNVLRGDMSLVGPRPLLMKYLPYYSQQELQRFAVRPGITGLAQINGRNFLGWNERFKLDIQYVNKHNVLLDTKILLLTLHKVVHRDNVADMRSQAMIDLDVQRSENANCSVNRK